MGRLDGKVALVTGGGSGIGRQTSIRFAEEGARVVVADLRGDTAEETAAEIRAAGAESTACAMDVTRSADVAAGVQAAIESFGGVDVVVNNAGITITGAAHDLTEDDWDRELAINLKSVYLVSKALWPHFLSAAAGRSCRPPRSPGLWAIPDDAAYCASKAGVIMLTKCLALDGAKAGIRANCVCPGFIQTPMIDGYFADQEDPGGVARVRRASASARAPRRAARHRRRLRLPGVRRRPLGDGDGAHRRRRADRGHLGRLTGGVSRPARAPRSRGAR